MLASLPFKVSALTLGYSQLVRLGDVALLSRHTALLNALHPIQLWPMGPLLGVVFLLVLASNKTWRTWPLFLITNFPRNFLILSIFGYVDAFWVIFSTQVQFPSMLAINPPSALVMLATNPMPVGYFPPW